MCLSGILWFCQLVVYGFVRHSCGTPIVGGQIVQRNEIPRYSYIVSLQDRVPLGNGSVLFRHFCGGSLISTVWVLTAGHCVYFKNETQIVAATGYENLKSEEVDYRVVDKIELNNFLPLGLKNDIALVRLRDPVPPGDQLSLGLLPEAWMNHSESNPCTVIGYGAEKYDGQAKNELKKAEVSIISQNKCTSILGKIMAPQKGDLSFCALGDLQDSCQGDSGGPLICKVDGKSYIFGIVSHGLTCGQPGVPSIYTSTAPYKPWIDRVTKDGI